jgi:hypothetical protein
MNERLHAIQDFWRWLQAHRADLDVLTDSDASFWDLALTELKRLDKHLWFELSKPDGGNREFIVTAEGHTEIFSLVDALVAHAPLISGWDFIALKPPMGFDFVTHYEGIQFDPSAMSFLPLENKSDPLKLGLRIGVPNFVLDVQRLASSAVLVILDTALGERAAALDVDYVEVSSLPDSPESCGYIALPELPHFIDYRKRRNRNA